MVTMVVEKLLSALLASCLLFNVSIPSATMKRTVLATVTINGSVSNYGTLAEAIKYASAHSSASVKATVSLTKDVSNCPSLKVSSGNIVLNLEQHAVNFAKNINGIDLTGGTLTVDGNGQLIGDNNANRSDKYSVIKNEHGTFNVNNGKISEIGNHGGPVILNKATANIYDGDIINASDAAACDYTGKLNIYGGNFTGRSSFIVYGKDKDHKVNIVPNTGKTVSITNNSAAGRYKVQYMVLNANIGGGGTVSLKAASGHDCQYGVSNTNLGTGTLIIDLSKASSTKGAIYNLDSFSTQNKSYQIFAGNNESDVKEVSELTDTVAKKKYVKIVNQPTDTITYETNGGEFVGGFKAPTTYTETFGTALPTAKNIKKAGFTFGGWYESRNFSGNAVASISSSDTKDKIYYAKWIENPNHTITFDLNNGTFVEGYTSPSEYKEGLGVSLPTAENVSRDFYSFGGWYENPNFSGDAVTAISALDAADKIYYAKWIENSNHTVTLNENGGTYVEGFEKPTKYYDGVGLTLPTSNNIKKDGYVFDGWCDNADLKGTTVTSITAQDASDKTFYAKWIKIGSILDKHYSTEQVFDCYRRISNVENLEYQYCYNFDYPYIQAEGNEDDYAPQVNTIQGYGTDGWYYKFDNDGTMEGFPITLKLYDASGELVKLISDNGLIENYGQGCFIYRTSENRASGQANYTSYGYFVTTLQNEYHVYTMSPFISCFALSSSENSSAKKGTSEKYVIAKSGELTEDNIENTQPVNITLTFSYNGQTYTKSSVKDEVCVIPAVEFTAPEHFEFAGWNTKEDGTGEMYGNTATFSNDTTLYAIYKLKTHSVTLNEFDGTYVDGFEKPTTYGEGVGLMLPTAESIKKAGYTFDGWYENADFSGDAVTAITSIETGDKTFYAKWTKIPVKSFITLNTNGGIYAGDYTAPTQYTEGVGAALPTQENIKRDGYTFDGWYESTDFSGDAVTAIASTETGDKTFYAKWTKIPVVCNITLNADEAIYVYGYKAPKQYTEGLGAALPTQENIKRDGYTFDGWYENADFSGDEVTSIASTETGDKTYYAKWTKVSSFVKPTFTRTDNTLILSDSQKIAATVGYAYIGISNPQITSWNSFVSAGLKHTDVNGKTGYSKKVSPKNGYNISLDRVGNYVAYIRYSNEDGVDTIDYYPYNVEDNIQSANKVLPMFTEDGNNKVLVSNGYKIISIGYSYTGHTPHYFQNWTDFVNYGLKYTGSNGADGYKKVLSPADGEKIALNDGGYYTCFIKYYDENNNIKYVGTTYQIGDQSPYFIMNSDGGAQMFDNGFEIVSTGYIYCPEGTDIEAAKTWDGFLKAGSTSPLNTDEKYWHEGYSTVTYKQNLSYRKIYDPSNKSILYFDAAENGFTGGSYISYIKYKDGKDTKYVWEVYNIIG